MIYLNKSVEFHYLTICNKLFIETSARDIDSSLLDLGISHLTGNGALPNKFVETFFLGTSLDGRGSHIGRTDCLVSLLCSLGLSVELSRFAILVAPQLAYLLLASIDTQCRKIDRVGTHVCDLTVFI